MKAFGRFDVNALPGHVIDDLYFDLIPCPRESGNVDSACVHFLVVAQEQEVMHLLDGLIGFA